MAEKLIYSVYHDPLTGDVIEPYLVKLLDDGKFSYSYKKVSTDNIPNHDYPFTDADKQLIKLCTETSHHNLAKVYNKKKTKDDDFLRVFVQVEKQKELLDAYVSKRNDKILHSLRGDILYVREKSSDHPGMIERKVLEGAATVVYNFSKTPKGTYYYLTVKQAGVYLNLKNKTTRIICHTPCWIMISDNIYHFEDETDAGKLQPFLTKPYITIEPRMEASYFEKFVLKAVKHFEVHNMGFDIVDVGGKKGALLKLVRDIDGNFAFNLLYTYDRQSIAANEPEKILAEMEHDRGNFTFKRLKRDEEFEQSIEKKILALGLKLKYGAIYTFEGEQHIGDILAWVAKSNEALAKYHISVKTDVEGHNYYSGHIKLNFTLSREENDWFDLYGIVEFEGFKIPFIRFKNNILRNMREYSLPDGRIAILPDEWFEKYRPIMAFAQAEGDAMRLKKYHAPLAEEALIDGGHSVDIKFKDFYRADKGLTFDAPEGLNALLRPYQHNGYSWMRTLSEYNVGGCLADDMGLGKTVQVIALLQNIYGNGNGNHVVVAQPVEEPVSDVSKSQLSLFEGEIVQPVVTDEKVRKRPTLIVMPPSLVYNWENELHKFAPNIKVFKYVSAFRSKLIKPLYTSQVILTTYGVVRNDLDILGKIDFEYVVLDESQLIKNPDSQSYKAVKQLNSRHKLTLTGTPVENSLIDLWSQLSFTNPGLLGGYEMFRREFVLPIEKRNDEMARKRLKSLITPFILRRTKEQVAKDLPPLTERVFYTEMTERQAELYEREKSHYRNVILQNIEKEGVEKSKMVIFQGLMKLRLIANHPQLTNLDKLDDKEVIEEHTHAGSGKFNEVIRLLETLKKENHKVLIFSQFVKHLNLFKDWFEHHKIPYSYLIGNTTNRKEVITEFEENADTKFFLISLKAGGVGLNLTAADYVFMLDPWWNPAVEAQAINRAHRIGQTKNVIAYKFICKNTIEEKILALQQRKWALAEDFISNNNPLSSLSTQEIADLFA